MTATADSNSFLGLFSFNWLPALYASDAHLMEWASLLPEKRSPADRLVHKVSQDILHRYELTSAFLPWIPANPWILAPAPWLEAACLEIAIAMASGSVRQTVSSIEVSRWVGLIGVAGRARAFQYARDYPRIAHEFAAWQPTGKVELLDAGSVVLRQLAEAALLAEASERQEPAPSRIAQAGACRFGLRFRPAESALPPLSPEAQSEAAALFESLTARPTEQRQAA